MASANWAGNYAYRARAIHAPTTREELQEVVSRAPRIHAIGSRHSFTNIADSDELVTVERLTSEVVVGQEGRTVTCGGGLRYGELAVALEREGLALANLASLPHIAVAGAVASATHGSGVRNGNLARSVAGLELITSDGQLHEIPRGDPDFEGVVVGLGALGVVTRVTLDTEPYYEVSQQVFEGLEWTALLEHFDEIMSSGYSVSVFTLWSDEPARVWVKSRGDEQLDRDELVGASAASQDRNPVPGIDPVNATAQLGIPGPWYDRLPHFRMGFALSGAEIQSEYIVAREDALDAIQALCGVASTVRPLLQVSEIRAIAADSLWLSPQYEQDTVAFHFTWKRDQDGVERALVDVEEALAPFGARPHWGKLFLLEGQEIEALYERLPDFRRLCERLDPRGAFRNEWLERHVLGAG